QRRNQQRGESQDAHRHVASELDRGTSHTKCTYRQLEARFNAGALTAFASSANAVKVSANRKADVAVVGAGILGLAHAYFAAKRGRSVVVFERSPGAQGASVRNFGMIWPIGQRAGAVHQMAMRSRQIWQELLNESGLPYRPNGSLHVVYHRDEAEVAREFAERAPGFGYTCTWLSPAEVLKKSQSVNPAGLRG